MKIATYALVASIASVTAFAPSQFQNAGHYNTEINARPKLATKKVGTGKKPVATKAKAVKKEPAITFPAVKLPWDNSKPVTAKKVTPVKKGRAKVAARGPSLFDRVSNMDLYAPVANQNDYGARKGKNLSQGKLSQRSYVPAGMTKVEYEKIRQRDQKKKDDNYSYNVAKGGKFKLFYDFYKNRGTDTDANWRDVTNKHTMAKTKYDWQGDSDLAGGGSGTRFTGR